MTNKNWFIVTILLFITFLAWVIFNILHTSAKVEIPPETLELIEPLNPEFDISALN